MSYTPLSAIIAAANSAVQSTQTTMVNGSGDTLDALTPVRVDINGEMQMIDVSTDASALSVVGITKASIPDTMSGSLATHGRIEDVTTAFAVGDYVYVSKTGELTNILPEAGSNGFLSGDFIIRIGVVAKNELDGNKKDMFIGISVIGQL